MRAGRDHGTGSDPYPRFDHGTRADPGTGLDHHPPRAGPADPGEGGDLASGGDVRGGDPAAEADEDATFDAGRVHGRAEADPGTRSDGRAGGQLRLRFDQRLGIDGLVARRDHSPALQHAG
ncbi:hypothetical protein [Streptomyces achromogenes]|uniref:hypothetical protein n=1 Tax=Streptomyces achromogenes TaxID=67255 RepID=UPI0036A31CF8